MRCSELRRRGRAWLRGLAGTCLALVLAAPAFAHKASDAYLRIEEGAGGLAVRWDIALRDLDAAIDLDADGDAKLTWGEIRRAWPRIEAYALAHLRIEGCALRPGARSLERRNDGAYAALHLTADCHPASVPAIAYTLFREVDPTHRGIARIELAGRPLALVVLDPTRAPDVSTVTAATLGHGSGGVAGQGVEGSAASRGGAAVEDSLRAAGGTNGEGGSKGDGGPKGESGSTLEGGAQPAGGAWTAGLGFAREGVHHILTGYDHVLFLLCLLLPSVMRRTPDGWQPVERLSQAVWPVVGIVSAFTVAHSITLGLAATGLVSLSPAFIEPAIAVTIVLAALDNVWPIFPVRRVVVTFCFGLIHGFGFAGVLRELDLPTARFAWALLQFNLGLEIGQLLIVVAVTALLFALRSRRRYPAWVIGGGSCAAIAVGVIWIIERTANVSLLRF
jgi:hypothetical protein